MISFTKTTTPGSASKTYAKKRKDQMTVYIAGRYSRRDEFRLVAKQLEDAGIFVASRWLHEDKPLQTQMGDDSEDFYIETQEIDLADIESADEILFFAEDPLIGTPRGGRHVEFGFALAIARFFGNMRISVIGPKENVFHYNSNVKHFDSLENYIAAH
jgi:hypothetical protein